MNQKLLKLTDILMTIYVLFYLCIFPMAIRNKYFDILNFRYVLFWKPTAVYMGIFAVIGIVYLIANHKMIFEEGPKAANDSKAVINAKARQLKKSSKTPTDLENAKESNHKILLQTCIERFHLTKSDIVFTFLFLEIGISTLLAPHLYEAFWGNRGRYQGFFLWIFFFGAYILVTRFYHYRQWHLYCILFFMIFPCTLGIVQFFTIDPFHFFDGTDSKYRYIFLSTIGNIDTYGAYTAMMLGLCVGTFTYTKDKILTGFSFLVMFLVMIAHLMAVSDNTLLSTAAIFAFLPFVLWKDDRGFLRYWIAVDMFLLAMLTCGRIMDSGVFTINFLDESFLIGLGRTILIKAMFLFLTGALIVYVIYLIRKKTVCTDRFLQVLRKIWTTLLIIGVCAVVLCLILANLGVQNALFSRFQQYLIFKDTWGTGRGLNWRLGFEYFKKDAGFLHIFFGYGPDTYFILMTDRYKDIIKAAGYGAFDSAHNEYIEYLATIGILGLVLYILYLVRSMQQAAKDQTLISFAAMTAVFAYMVQASINIAIPIITPIFMILLSIMNRHNS